MRFWLIKREEPVPIAGHAGDRILRMGTLAFSLAERGHDAVWWSSSFDHLRKRHRVEVDTSVQLGNRLEVRMLRGCGYRRNLSPVRLVDEGMICRKFTVWARRDPAPPDLIISALPSVEWCRAAVAFGRASGVPVVLDMRDMWPDIFVELPPRALRPLARLLLAPLFRRAHQACAGATAITGITEAFVEWGVSRAGRARGPLDRCFPFGYTTTPPSPDRLAEAGRWWDARGVTANGAFTVCFVGSIDRQRDIGTIIDAARRLASAGVDVRFVFCGEGERLATCRELSTDVPGVLWPGWVDAAAIHVLLRRSSIGLNPTPDRFDYLASINNKAIEYLSAGLPVISSPATGVLADLLAAECCGLSYRRGDGAELARLILRLHADEASRRHLSANAFHLYQERFTAQKVYGEMVDHLEVIASAGRNDRESVRNRHAEYRSP